MTWNQRPEVRIVPLPTQEGIKFDLILPDGYIITLSMDEYEVRQYRGTISAVIEAKVLDWMQNNEYTTEGIQFIFC